MPNGRGGREREIKGDHKRTGHGRGLKLDSVHKRAPDSFATARTHVPLPVSPSDRGNKEKPTSLKARDGEEEEREGGSGETYVRSALARARFVRDERARKGRAEERRCSLGVTRSDF